MRISANRLRINSGRFRERIPRIERRCQLCNQSVPVDLEDEFHFILKCQCFTDLRNIYISRFFRSHPSMFKFLNLLNSTNKRALTNLCLYIKFATERRDALLLNINYMYTSILSIISILNILLLKWILHVVITLTCCCVMLLFVCACVCVRVCVLSISTLNTPYRVHTNTDVSFLLCFLCVFFFLLYFCFVFLFV